MPGDGAYHATTWTSPSNSHTHVSTWKQWDGKEAQLGFGTAQVPWITGKSKHLIQGWAIVPQGKTLGLPALPRRSQVGTGNKKRLAQREGAKPHCPWVRNWTDRSMCSSTGHRFQNKLMGSCGVTKPFVSEASRALFSLSSQYSNCHKISILAGVPNLVLLTKVFPPWQEGGASWSWQRSCSLWRQRILKLYPNSGQSSLNTPTRPSHKLQQTPQELRQVTYVSTQHLDTKGLRKSPLNSFSGLRKGQLTAHLLP